MLMLVLRVRSISIRLVMEKRMNINIIVWMNKEYHHWKVIFSMKNEIQKILHFGKDERNQPRNWNFHRPGVTDGLAGISNVLQWQGIGEINLIFSKNEFCFLNSSRTFGSHLDIHSGGLDLVFPHHANEILQSNAFHNIQTWSKYWLHAGRFQSIVFEFH